MGVPHYDDLGINEDILLDLPHREGTGTITHDVGKYHQHLELKNTPTWTDVDGLPVLQFNGTDEYGEIAGADSTNLDITSGDYSFGCWLNWQNTGTSEILIGRYEVSVAGWEIYLTATGGHLYLTNRHHHAAGASTRTACTSDGWTESTWLFLGISRSGTKATHYRNGLPIDDLICSDGGLIDPETTNQDLVVATRYTKNANWGKFYWWRPRFGGSALSADDWAELYEQERGRFA